MRILVNGLGCTYTGARFVLEQLLLASATDNRITAIVPIVPGVSSAVFPPHVKTIALQHSIWGSYLRVLIELWINIVIWFRRYDAYINLSNYGLCFSARQSLYIHNPLIMDMSATRKFGQGNPNFLVRLALNSCLKNAEKIFVQTDHMRHQLASYCSKNAIGFPKRVIVLKPPFPEAPTFAANLAKDFAFQLFYPASDFPHKRTDLAIAGTVAAQRRYPEIGLIVTTTGTTPQNGIRAIGIVPRSDVYRYHSASDALLFTSKRETLGLPLLEAMHYEKPAVLPDRDYAREIYGDAAVYYKEDSPEAVAQAIGKVYSDYEHYVSLVRKRKESELKSRISWSNHWDVFLMKS